MLDDDLVDQLRMNLINRFTADELCEILNLEPEDIIERFFEEVLRTNWSEHL